MKSELLLHLAIALCAVDSWVPGEEDGQKTSLPCSQRVQQLPAATSVAPSRLAGTWWDVREPKGHL